MRVLAVGIFLAALIGAACGGDNASTTPTSTGATGSTTTTTLTGPTTTKAPSATATTTTQPPAATSTTDSADPAAAQNCVELADMTIETHQTVLTALGGEQFEGEMPPEVADTLEEALEFVSQLGLAEELCAGGFAEFDRLRCERVSSLETFGLDWETTLNQIFPPCGGGPVGAAAVTDASVATSCEELADIDIAILQEFINVFGDGPFENWYTDSTSVSPEIQAGLDVFVEKANKSSEQSDSLGCDVGNEAEKQHVCDRMGELDSLGDAGLGFIHDMVACDLDPADQARLDDFLNSQQS